LHRIKDEEAEVMFCTQCQREIADDSTFCRFCGASQAPAAGRPALGARRLARSVAERKIAGVCGGIAAYLDVDVALVRVIWVVLSIVPGGLLGGVIAYLAAWIVMPESDASVPRPSRLRRSAGDYKIAGVCGGLAEFFGVDATAVRLLWVILSIVPGGILGGILAYVLAWAVMPAPGPSQTAAVVTP
jgi:phage shock protein PspC (stress-responsive transcriptional regulator)